MAVLREISRAFDENGIYVASRRYSIDALSYIHIEIDDYVGWNYKFFIYNIDKDEHPEIKHLELVVAIRSYKKLSKEVIERIVNVIEKNKDNIKDEEEVIEKEVAEEDYPAYISTKVDGLDFLINYLE